MIYLLTTCILDVTYGIIDWTTRKLFSYAYRNIYSQPVLTFADILEEQQNMLNNQKKLVENYQQIIEQQQEKIDKLLNYSKFN